MMELNRYKITLEYLGAGFCGWQRQKELLSIQQVIEEAIFKFSREKIVTYVSGRTDAGVNASGQVAHFDLKQKYDPLKVMYSINHFVRPHKVGVVDCQLVSQDFHARFSSKMRHYVYRIINRKQINIINSELKSWIKQPLDIKAMQAAAGYLIGKHDFSSFRDSQCQSKSPIKTLTEIKIIHSGDDIDIYFSAPSFLHHMVRNIVGSLLMVGKGKWSLEKMKEVLVAKDRSKAGPTAEATGLYFLKVDY